MTINLNTKYRFLYLINVQIRKPLNSSKANRSSTLSDGIPLRLPHKIYARFRNITVTLELNLETIELKIAQKISIGRVGLINI
jgi:hypothetical protein